MPVKAFVRRDAKQDLPPVHSSETAGALSLLQRLYASFRDELQEYVVIANLDKPQADLVVLTELGVGIVELKHNSGQLRVNGSTWMTEYGQVKAGSESKGFANPREQVQSYANTIRDGLLPRCAVWWSLMEHNLRKNMRVQSAVCFTHPGMVISAEVKSAIIGAADIDYSRFGRFDLLIPNEFPAWAAALRFELVENRDHLFRPYRLDSEQIVELIKDFHGVDWTTASALMPSDQAYAYLMSHDEQGEAQVFPLHTLELQIGRSASSCALTVPRGHGRVSRVHAQIHRYGDQIWLRDLQSTYGTYLNSVRVGQAMLIESGDLITLGGAVPGPGIYACTFMRRLPTEVWAMEPTKP